MILGTSGTPHFRHLGLFGLHQRQNTLLHSLTLSVQAIEQENTSSVHFDLGYGADRRTAGKRSPSMARPCEDQLPGVHLLTAYAHQVKAALAQLAVPGYTNDHKAALQLLNILPLKDTVVTGDAMFCQKDLSGKVLRKGGHYIWPVKDNQPQRKRADHHGLR